MRADLQLALANRPVQAEAVLTDAEKTQFIARATSSPLPPGPPPVATDDYGAGGSSNRRSAWIWAAVVAALLIVIGVAAFAIVQTSGSDAAKKVGVPALIGLSPQMASALLMSLVSIVIILAVWSLLKRGY